MNLRAALPFVSKPESAQVEAVALRRITLDEVFNEANALATWRIYQETASGRFHVKAVWWLGASEIETELTGFDDLAEGFMAVMAEIRQLGAGGPRWSPRKPGRF